MGNKKIFKKGGKHPILVVCIHSCANSKSNPQLRPEAVLTRELSDMLRSRLDYHFFVYKGYRTKCIRDTKVELRKTIKSMLHSYGFIGVMSLHGRSKKYAQHGYPNSVFELGSLRGKSLYSGIAKDLWVTLSDEEIIYDDNVKFTGGREIRLMHRSFNDCGYKRGKASTGHNPRKNRCQIAQLEFNDWMEGENWIKNGIDQRFYACNVLGNLMIEYVTRQRVLNS